jgi:hypothetical protein
MQSGLLFGAVSLAAGPHIGDIEFFGYSGLDLAKVRASLPVHEGDAFPERGRQSVRAAVTGAIGKEPTDVNAVCCDQGKILLYIGLPGGSNRAFAYNPVPTGPDRLPPEIMKLHAQFDRALEKAVRKGGDAATEDDSNGYALFKDPAVQTVQLQYRTWAVDHEQEVFRVLESSSVPEDRRVAGELAGYTKQSPEQNRALLRAARDPDTVVRNNVTRALEVILTANAKLAADIPADTFIEMLNSGLWTDRNKGCALLMRLTEERDAALLAKIRAQAFDSLVEMASWREAGHAWFARIVLGRVAGIPEEQLRVMASRGAEEIVAAARRH